ncbi:MAG TPA: tripartite tricarboxylate transporter permease [Pusillimonas sp.]|uniref:tripartite tricarboxylate transporter permease n=1 Tax=unclassified Pusillimonas TaxID=2640016 RepID=UPI00261ED5CD|nr:MULTISPECIES: tripartite tricarboxylate transporter permease [unclassified Pusillimonas]HLU18973.1 tripartite tricarboxylate transporter permease [Pusillimonas sp.]
MELLEHLFLGFSVALSPENLAYAFVGCLLGTLIGVLPGIGPVPTIALLLPITYILPPVAGLIMLAGIYYGAQYGGSTTAILVALPGETSSVVTVLDGHQMARNGRAGAALSIAALGSFFAGCVATLIVAAFATPLVKLSFKFSSAEYFSLMVLGLVAAVVLASGSITKALAMIVLGLLLGMVGTDINSGIARYDFGLPALQDGVDFAIVAMGVFGLAEIMKNLEIRGNSTKITERLGSLYPNQQEIRQAGPAVLRGTAIGSLLGILPGAGTVLSSFASYTLEKRMSRKPASFGTGAPAGLAGPESANNAASQTSFIPLLTLGIPGNAVMALMIGAMTIHSIQPGPQVMSSHPELFWGLIASMWLGNLILVVLNLPLVGLWVKLLKIPYYLLFPAILVFCAIGVFSVNLNTFDVVLLALFAVAGYVLSRLNCEAAPLLLGLVLGPMLEENFRRTLIVSRGDFSIFLTRPISLGLLLTALVLVIAVAIPSVRNKRDDTFVAED